MSSLVGILTGDVLTEIATVIDETPMYNLSSLSSWDDAVLLIYYDLATPWFNLFIL